MKKIRTYLIFLLLVILWSFFFGAIKFAVRSGNADLQGISLETITGFLSIGTLISFLIGTVVLQSIRSHYLLCCIGLGSAGLVFLLMMMEGSTLLMLSILMVCVGLFYGLRTVSKTILIGREIHKTGFADTTINARVNTAFVGSFICGSWLGSVWYESFAGNTYRILQGILVFAACVGLFALYPHDSFQHIHTKKESQLKLLYITAKKYFLTIVTSSLLRAISLSISQLTIDHSVITLDISRSDASSILILSAIGSVIGNGLSLLVQKKRRQYLPFFIIGFGFFAFILPIVDTLLLFCVLSLTIGVFFGASTNLIDSHFFGIIALDENTEQGSVVFGCILNLTIVCTMFLTYYSSSLFGFAPTILLLGSSIVIVGLHTLRWKIR